MSIYPHGITADGKKWFVHLRFCRPCEDFNRKQCEKGYSARDPKSNWFKDLKPIMINMMPPCREGRRLWVLFWTKGMGPDRLGQDFT